jgi:hypothetical protein
MTTAHSTIAAEEWKRERMEADPPYLTDAGHPGEVRLSVAADPDTAMIEIEVRGRWCRSLSMDVYCALRDCLAEHPLAIIIDLHGLIDVDAASTAMWLAAGHAVKRLHPPAQLALCLPPTRQLASRMRRLGAVRFLSIHATMKQARAATAGRLPPLDRLHLCRLRPEPASAVVAGDAVAVACAAWNLPDLSAPGQQIVRELVANAVVHAGTDMTLTMSVRGPGLHLAVHDGDPRLPAVPAGAGRGLRMVESRASAWGAMPTRDGKVVWALVRQRPHGSP